MFTRITQFTISFIITGFLISCGGGGVGPLAEGGIGGSGISTGTVTGFGSVYVNGVKFETASTTFSGDDNESNQQSGLKVGMVVTVKGNINADGITGTALNIKYEDLIEGPISTKGSNDLTIMGHIIKVNTNTQYQGTTTFALLSKDDVVEISGFYDTNNDISATYIEVTSSSIHEITGKVSSFTDGKFMINNKLTVNSSTTVAVGNYVEAKGSYASGELTASNVIFKTEGFDVSGDTNSNKSHAELEGLATSICGTTAPCSFNIKGISVSVTNTTIFESGVADDIVAGTHLEVEGSLTSGTLIAKKIKFKSKVEINVKVDTVISTTTTTKTLSLINTSGALTGLTIVVNTDPNVTEFDDAIQYLTIGDTSGEYFRFRGIMDGSALIANRVSSGNTSRITIKGEVEKFDAGPGTQSITVLGITVVTSIAGFQLILNDDSDAGVIINDPNNFYDLLIKNHAVAKVRGDMDDNTGVITWREIKLDL